MNIQVPDSALEVYQQVDAFRRWTGACGTDMYTCLFCLLAVFACLGLMGEGCLCMYICMYVYKIQFSWAAGVESCV